MSCARPDLMRGLGSNAQAYATNISNLDLDDHIFGIVAFRIITIRSYDYDLGNKRVLPGRRTGGERHQMAGQVLAGPG